MSKILNLTLVTLFGIGAAKAQQIQINPYDGSKVPQINLEELFKTNELPIEKILLSLDKSSFAYRLKKDVLEYGERSLSKDNTVVFHGRGFNQELGREVYVSYFPEVKPETFSKSPVGEFFEYNDELLAISINSAGTSYEGLAKVIHIYDGEFGKMDGKADLIKGSNISFSSLVLYNKLHELTDEQKVFMSEADYLLQNLAEHTRLDAEVLAKAGLPF